jgi:phage shock protein C
MNKLYRSNRDKMVAGVCGGLAEYFNVDSSLIRLLWVLLIIFGGSGLLLYIIGWVVIPEREGVEETRIEGGDLIPRDSKTNTLFGVLLIGLGAILLFDHFFPWRSLARYWPVVLIVVGVIMISGWRGDRK